MASKRCSLIWVVLILFMLSFSSKALARNIPDVPKLLEDSDEMGPNKRLLFQVPKCRRGRITSEIRADKPRCHHYF
ncbi:hypothetical protein MtrunA17_Chr4g0018961 [Medicago truncatula]|uniref:RALF-like protein n=1 Tax=Medicago truncatula TaxID=3880 RepID=A0A072UUC0_MEDTR|nr:RALF-like protein [Medicago truncatula]KEH29455.1 RALF-like protein [Medicago truncatula]RHN59876.1 hypothetical protein MtrunA17_Chr4g0018961 [Medicago truncatula]